MDHPFVLLQGSEETLGPPITLGHEDKGHGHHKGHGEIESE